MTDNNTNLESTLKGEELKTLKLRFLRKRTQDNLLAFLMCLADTSYLWIPMNVKMNAEDEQAFLSGKEGDTITTTGEVHLQPDWLSRNDGKLFLPIFSKPEEAPEDYRNNFSWINLTVKACIDLVKNNQSADGFVLDAFTKPCDFNQEIIALIESLPTLVPDHKFTGLE